MRSEAQLTQERRSGTQALIENMLRERQQMLVLYERLVGVAPYGSENPTRELLTEF